MEENSEKNVKKSSSTNSSSTYSEGKMNKWRKIVEDKKNSKKKWFMLLKFWIKVEDVCKIGTFVKLLTSLSRMSYK